jgi:hypothetical protein
MSRAKMMYARGLIQEKQYKEARAILENIDHPTAREWLEKLNRIDPQKSPKNVEQQQQRGSCIVLILLLAIGFTLFSVWILRTDSQLPSISQPTQIPLEQCSGQHLITCYRDQMTAVLEQNGGRIVGRGDNVYSDGRIESWIDVRLSQTNSSIAARRVIENGLRVFAKAVPPEKAGSIVITVSWNRDNQECTDNAGMGYETMKMIDWETASQEDIFTAINRNIYGDGDAHYSQMGFAPDPSVFPACNR